jgi:hypothetical protein
MLEGGAGSGAVSAARMACPAVSAPRPTTARPPTRDVRVLLQAADLVDGREHLAELAQALGEQLKLEEHGALVHLEALCGRRVARGRQGEWLRSCSGGAAGFWLHGEPRRPPHLAVVRVARHLIPHRVEGGLVRVRQLLGRLRGCVGRRDERAKSWAPRGATPAGAQHPRGPATAARRGCLPSPADWQSAAAAAAPRGCRAPG